MVAVLLLAGGPVFFRSRFGVDPDAFSGALDDSLIMASGLTSQTAPVEYAVAWSDARHQRHLGRARVEDLALVLEGTPPGGVRRTLRIPAADVTTLELNRWRPSPAVAVESPEGEVVVELLLGGWGAAHQLQNAIASARADAPEPTSQGGPDVTDQIAILAEIRPGKRGDLERALAQGPPFDLMREGFEHHEVFLGDTDVVFVFTGPGAASELRRIAATPEQLRRVIHMTEMLSAPRLLEQTFRWSRDHSDGRHANAS
jgi:hypothetical protein